MHSTDPVYDAQVYWEAEFQKREDHAAEVRGLHQEFLKLARQPGAIHEQVFDLLDCAESPHLDDVVQLFINAAHGMDVRAQATEMLDALAWRWAEQEEVL